MQNSEAVIARSRRPGYGPAPTAGRAAATMSRPRAQVLAVLRDQSEPVTLATLATLTGLHANTVREHLDALVRQGLAGRHAAEPRGRGRPALLYRATGAVTPPSEYGGLAAALAATLHRTSDNPYEDATEAGIDWGRSLASDERSRRTTTTRDARRRLVSLLDELGFGPAPDATLTDISLTRCPLLEAARRYPDVVCGVHLGLVRGALQEYGAPHEGAELVPFAEPGACRLRLGTAGLNWANQERATTERT